jgi:inhibitor of cysteine peptidase
MEKKRVFITGLVIALLSFTVVVAGCTSSTSSNNASSAVQTSENASMTKTGNVNTSSAQVQTSENASMTKTGNVTNATPGEPVTVAQGQIFTITLRSNPSTGYSWEPRYDHAALSLTDSAFISDPNPHNLVGVPGSQVFTFQGLAKGTTTITFDNVSPSQIVTEQTTYSVTVT